MYFVLDNVLIDLDLYIKLEYRTFNFQISKVFGYILCTL